MTHHASHADDDLHAAAHDTDPARHWDEHYGTEQRWSGNANRALVDVVTETGAVPGRALDVGCGEGGDAIWLAHAGWQVTAVDVSAVALERARGAAQAAGVADAIEFVQADLATWEPAGSFDLVSACFFHSEIELARMEILRRLAATLTSGGALLVVGHASVPSWAPEEHRHHVADLPNATQTVTALELAEPQWHTVIAEDRGRKVTAPDGTAAEIDDAVVLVRRA
ncbi:class I SAM-dependent methyltransferase [Rhodococcus rhodnii]|uniref:Methyltransferase domain-containing protein n=2 Tax=Rhodococcus rhodnii TaxID=38312 RepID=R7WM03_9NOCA|nr:class I SAM-dependent methyltransferase [Rhodococcus rhodnii]EOM76346.1 hypothetical protein Rrhod_2347 [Rhodococcus rhodnii LMG 5362]TXG90011.1 class I SAM-dependent methyltransferase [Rhodococcus rhodnii]